MDSSAAPPRGDGEEVSRWGRRVWFPLLPYTVWRAEWGKGGIFSPSPSGITVPSIRSKKLNWVVFMRLIQASIVNDLVIYNASGDGKNEVGTKEFVIPIAKSYMRKGQVKREPHRIAHQNKLKVCSHFPIRTRIFCKECKSSFCNPCFKENH